MRTLDALGSAPGNMVVVKSSRSCDALAKCFVGCRSVVLAAEHGMYVQWYRDEPWQRMVGHDFDMSWCEYTMPVLNYFTERTPGSVLEINELFVAWHYRGACVYPCMSVVFWCCIGAVLCWCCIGFVLTRSRVYSHLSHHPPHTPDRLRHEPRGMAGAAVHRKPLSVGETAPL